MSYDLPSYMYMQCMATLFSQPLYSGQNKLSVSILFFLLGKPLYYNYPANAARFLWRVGVCIDRVLSCMPLTLPYLTHSPPFVRFVSFFDVQ